MMPTLATFIQDTIGNSSHINQTRQRNRIEIRKEEVKLSQFADDLIYIHRNPKEATRKLLEVDIKLIFRSLLHFYTQIVSY